MKALATAALALLLSVPASAQEPERDRPNMFKEAWRFLGHVVDDAGEIAGEGADAVFGTEEERAQERAARAAQAEVERKRARERAAAQEPFRIAARIAVAERAKLARAEREKWEAEHPVLFFLLWLTPTALVALICGGIWYFTRGEDLS